jgi:hypothetical protein
MKRLVAYIALALALFVGVRVMMDATQNRPDAPAAGTSSTIDFTVDTRDFQRGEPAAADALWAVCAATVAGDVSVRPEAVDAGWRVTVTPAIGHHGQKRLVGCLEDVTIDRVVGHVTAIRTTTS